jgi:hypothetical protein
MASGLCSCRPPGLRITCVQINLLPDSTTGMSQLSGSAVCFLWHPLDLCCVCLEDQLADPVLRCGVVDRRSRERFFRSPTTVDWRAGKVKFCPRPSRQPSLRGGQLILASRLLRLRPYCLQQFVQSRSGFVERLWKELALSIEQVRGFS